MCRYRLCTIVSLFLSWVNQQIQWKLVAALPNNIVDTLHAPGRTWRIDAEIQGPSSARAIKDLRAMCQEARAQLETIMSFRR